MNSVKKIKEIGLDNFVNQNNLKRKDYGHKFSLKYDQLNTKKTPETNECRGLVLSNDLDVLSFPFVRFNNYSESTRSIINWDTATYWEKTDGTLIHYYFDPIGDKWCVGTTGTAEAVEMVSSRDKLTGERKDYDFSLTDLFYKTCEEQNVTLPTSKNYTYMFELATDANIVVNKYESSRLVLLGIRCLYGEYSEHDQDMLDGAARIFNCARPKQYFFESEKEMLDSLKNVKYGDDNFEGYVIVDDKFNRLKVKSNTYIIFSQFNGDLESKWRLVDVVLTNEIEEVSSTFPALKDTLLKLKRNYENKVLSLKETFVYLQENIDNMEKKDFFIKSQTALNYDKKNKPLNVIFSALNKNKNITFEEALEEVDKRKLFKILI